jgi:hypothetical protein
VACGFERVLEAAAEAGDTLNSQTPLRRDAVLAAAPELRRLSERLRAVPDARPQGVALAERLVTDRTGPLYLDAGPDCIERAACTAAELL